MILNPVETAFIFWIIGKNNCNFISSYVSHTKFLVALDIVPTQKKETTWKIGTGLHLI